jgi:predicted O-methyltransferase YrrM
MFAESDAQMPELGEMFRHDTLPAEATAQERADALSEFYLPVTPDAGRLIYSLVRASRPATVVEFGMSLGISAIHLASAVRDNGTGRVVTTELSADKVAAATRNFADAGLDDLITVLHGDALETLKSVEGPVGFVLLDGWKDLYTPSCSSRGWRRGRWWSPTTPACPACSRIWNTCATPPTATSA